MEATKFNYGYSKVTGESLPNMYPGESSDKWAIPKEIQNDFSKLNSIIETKYGREFLKVCAFYNKMFPSLKSSDWVRSSYNVPAFTALDQERSDTGTGTSSNYLKQVTDQITSRLGTINFQPKLIADEPTMEYIVYKDEAERFLKKVLRNDVFQRTNTEVFHDASILGYSHVFVDPFTGKLTKANDFEVGMYESQFNKDTVLQMLYRDYSFPVAEIPAYLVGSDEATQKKILEQLKDRSACDFKMYIDAVAKKCYVVIGGTALPPKDYKYDRVLIETFQWDVGFTRVTTTSLFDLLYPIQREINKVNAKIQQLIRLYKGSVPVFNSDVDLSMKAISNGSGEALYVDSSRPIDTLCTVIQPTPLDPELNAQVQAMKSEMFELAGIQNMSFDMNDMRSAAAVVALDQTRDSTFQAQLQGIAAFDKNVIRMYVEYMSKVSDNTETGSDVAWGTLLNLLDTAQVDLQPVHLNDPLSNEDKADPANTPDYVQLQTNRMALDVVKGKLTYDDLPFYVDPEFMCTVIATYLVKFSALGIPIPETMQQFLLSAFIDFIQKGKIALIAN